MEFTLNQGYDRRYVTGRTTPLNSTLIVQK